MVGGSGDREGTGEGGVSEGGSDVVVLSNQEHGVVAAKSEKLLDLVLFPFCQSQIYPLFILVSIPHRDLRNMCIRVLEHPSLEHVQRLLCRLNGFLEEFSCLAVVHYHILGHRCNS